MNDARKVVELIPGQWWAVLPSGSLGTKRPVGVERLGARLVLWRDPDGAARCAHAACPHRGADLGLGRLEAGELQCPYHGFRFAADGRCTAIPCEGPQARIPPRLALRMIPVQERHGWLWVHSALSEGPSDGALPWVPGAPEASRAQAVRQLAWNVPHGRVMEGMLDIHHFPFAHRRYFRTSAVRLDPYEAAWDADGVLRSRGTMRKEGATKGYEFFIDLAFPGFLHIRFGTGLGAVVACTPIDEERTWIGMRFLARGPALLMRLQTELSMWMELTFVQPDDLRMLVSSRPRHAEPSDGQYVHADKAAALWHARRREVCHGTPELRSPPTHTQEQESARHASQRLQPDAVRAS